jgi:anti-sigma-K factor RskA
VNPPVNDRNDQYYEDLVAAAAFGTLSASEAMELEEFLATSESARSALAELRMMMGGLAMLPDERQPPSALRDRIEHAVMADVAWAHPGGLATPAANGGDDDGIVKLSTVPVASSKRPTSLWRPYLLAAAVALLLAVVAGIVLDRVVLTDSDPEERESIAFELTTPIPDLSAQLTYDEDDQFFILETENMPAAPPDSVYQVWLIDDTGPKPVGVMDQSRFVVPAPRNAYDAFAITVEPGPFGSTGPTTDPFFIAPLTSGDTSDT